MVSGTSMSPNDLKVKSRSRSTSSFDATSSRSRSSRSRSRSRPAENEEPKISDQAIFEKQKKPRRKNNYMYIPRKKRRHQPDPIDLQRGQLITAVRNAADLTTAVKERLVLWPEGNEIIELLMLLKSEQICSSFCLPIKSLSSPSLRQSGNVNSEMASDQ